MGEWAVGGAIEHGSFLMAMAAVALACVVILLALGGVFAFLNLRRLARKEAKKVAQLTATEVSEATAVRYLEAELPNIIREYRELGGNAATYDHGDDIADSEGGKT